MCIVFKFWTFNRKRENGLKKNRNESDCREDLIGFIILVQIANLPNT